MALALFWALAFIAEIAGTIAGFGSSTILLPVALFFFEFKTALVLVAVFHISGSLWRTTFFRRGIDKRLLLTFGLPSVLLTAAGAFLVNYASQPILKSLLGLFLIAYAVISWKGTFSVKPSGRNAIAGGSISGFFAGLIGTGGALRSAFLTSFRLEKSVYIATSAVIALAVDITRIPIYLGSGLLPKNLLYAVPLLFTIALAGSFTGKKLVGRIPQKAFRKIVLAAILLAGMNFAYEGINYLL